MKSPATSAPLLSAQGVTKSFGSVSVLRDGRLELHAGSVHALCGGNGAGKSTFLNILMGLLQRDGGEIRVDGVEVNFSSPAEALRARISIITQELSPIPGMTVAENIFLGREPRRFGAIVDFGRLVEKAGALLRRLDFDIDPKTPMARLSLAQTQLVEIAKAFSHDSRIIIMDEPTSAIGEHETETLFKAIRSAASQGAAIIYVSHRLSEIFTIADRYTVFRDGQFVETGLIADIDRRHLVRRIVGQEVQVVRRPPQGERKTLQMLDVRALTRKGEFDGVSLSLSEGEILGIYGLTGSGRSEFLNCLYGITRADSGRVALHGKPVPPASPRQAIRMGMALVTEDRKDTGLVLSSSVTSNISLSALGRLSNATVVDSSKENELADEMIQRMRIKVATPSMPVTALSGGNQQKVVLARCMATEPICLLCDEPTRGIDEGAKREIYAFLSDFVKRGGAAIVVSSEAPEILDVSDRIAIFRKGQLTTIVDGRTATQEELLHLAS